MSWIADHKEDEGTAQETICRVYGHRLSAAATAALSSSGTKATTSSTAAWITLAELEAAAAAVAPADHPEAQSSLATLAWVRMWVMQQDEAGCPVRRGFGVATGAAGGFINWVGGGLASCCTARRTDSLCHACFCAAASRRTIKGRMETRAGTSILTSATARSLRHQLHSFRQARSRPRSTPGSSLSKTLRCSRSLLLSAS